MPQYLVTIQLPDNYDPSLEDEESFATSTRSTKRWMPPGTGFRWWIGTGKQGEDAAQAA